MNVDAIGTWIIKNIIYLIKRINLIDKRDVKKLRNRILEFKENFKLCLNKQIFKNVIRSC